ncbi:hypothetical protein QFZ97_007677 [Paraburkholderia youngii]
MSEKFELDSDGTSTATNSERPDDSAPAAASAT